MPAVPIHDTAVVDEPWDGPAQEAKLKTPVGKTGLQEFAWYDPNSPDTDGDDGYPDAKAGWKLPHHLVGDDGKPGAAVKNGCQAVLDRLDQTDIPDGDKAGVRRHVQHHLDALERQASAQRAEALAAALERDGDPHPAAPQANRAEPGASGEGIISSGFSDLDLARSRQAQEDDRAPLELILGKPWAITRQAAVEVATRLAMQAKSGVQIRADQIEAAVQRPSANRQAADGSEVAVIPLRGTITPRGSLFSLLFGGSGGLQGFRQQFRQAIADGNVSAVVIDIDSPGGLIDLVPETAAEIFNARGSKPIVAVCNTTCASAAYWIASAADQIVATPSAQAGSIGVFTIHEDFSKLDEAMGIKTTLISAGQFKVDGNPYEPLSKTARQALQNEVDKLYGMFTSQVGQGRGVSQKAVQAGYGRGRCLLAQDALAAGMVDRIETLEQTVSRLGGSAPNPARQLGDAIEDDEDGPSVAATETSPVAGETQDKQGGSAPSGYLSGQPARPSWAL